ncbi:Alkaline phosphatase-like alpha/beta/alpha [Penicillium hordei]|uniref:Alkaline phosphatase-like alpha/beta/alpha n=1 Tax=Penicillium hordei TaxID=40994 RepID=A0AAD6H9M0_9EURO|nr:Alkaline phosphatase-like alpha/beta/alpha [Penicillium hordei]KAJ5618108.1 Alkaline phosphatase-like alpha/beta/alpha [Penicillium hordei]
MAKRNILMIADDLGKQLGCYGNTKIQTPNLDQLASKGMKFEQAFTSTASCSASRSVIYTGLHTHQNGQYGLHNNRHHFTTFDHVHVGPSGVYPWDMRAESDSRDVAAVADQASAFFEKSSTDEKPFFLTIALIDPHRDWTQSGFGNDGEYDPRVKKIEYSPEDVEIPPFVNDLPGVRYEFAEYYKSISRLDQGVGMVLNGLKRSGLADDTLIIFLSNNRSPFINSKTTLYDAGVSLPLIMKYPGSPPGIVNPNTVSYTDILPLFSIMRTILAPSIQIVSVVRYSPSSLKHLLLRTGARSSYHCNIAWRLDFPFAADIYGSLTWEEIRNAGTSTKMIGSRPLKDYFFRPAEELYDIQADPNEIRNLANDAEYRSVLEDMRATLEKWQRRTEDAWLFRDGVSLLLVRHHLEAGFEVPDRIDFDVDAPESKGQPIFNRDLPWGAAVK